MKVSIVITAYNKERTIRKAVESAVCQTWDDVEVVVVEDKSTDGTRNILMEIADSYSNVLPILLEKNVGAGLSRRCGIKVSTGDYVLLLDGDDWLNNDFVESLARKAIEEDADMVTGGVCVRYEDGRICEVTYGEKTVSGEEKIVKYFGQTTQWLNNRLVRKSLYDKVPYSERRYIEDVQTCVALLWWANKNCFVDNCGYHYMQDADSLTHTADAFKENLFRTLCVADLVRFFAKHEPRYIAIYDLEGAYKEGLRRLSECNPTEEMVAPYRKEWEELRQFAES